MRSRCTTLACASAFGSNQKRLVNHLYSRGKIQFAPLQMLYRTKACGHASASNVPNTHPNDFGSHRVAYVEKYTTRATHSLECWQVVEACNTVCGRGVDTTIINPDLRHSPFEADVALLTPFRPPRISHEPIVSLDIVSAIADELHSVVDVDVALVRAGVDHSRAVVAPSARLN